MVAELHVGFGVALAAADAAVGLLDVAGAFVAVAAPAWPAVGC